MSARVKTALVLSGGGARAAYQVGVLRGLLDLGVIASGFNILAGSSAGSINAGALAGRADDIEGGIHALERVWSELRVEQVFRTDVGALSATGVRWAWDLTFGGAFGRVSSKSLLDTRPLRQLLRNTVKVERIGNHLLNGNLDALAIAATDLGSAEGVIFVDAPGAVPLWERRRWRVQRVAIGIDHLMASSAIPIFFPSIAIERRYYGDGCIRNTMPLRPAINLGADRIIAIGVRSPSIPARAAVAPPSIAEVAGVLLDAVMMDSIECDVEHAEHVNVEVHACAAEHGGMFRPVEVLWIQPSQSVSAIAAQCEHRIPTVVRYLMRGLGSDEALIELASYLLFDSLFCSRLLELGRADVAAARPRILEFFARPIAARAARRDERYPLQAAGTK